MSDNTSRQDNDLGFGTISRRGYGRMINRDGNFNVIRKGRKGIFLYDVFISLVNMKWWRFILMVVVYFIAINFVFAILYWLIGIENLVGADRTTQITSFEDAYFFSAQTLTTVGYGRIAPVHFLASTVAAIESLLGLSGFALATGLLYGRFSRPSANILFSENMLVTPHKGSKAVMFRMANKSRNQLIDAEVSVSMAHQTAGNNGEVNVNYKNLELDLKFIRFMPTNWTIVHTITEKSPLFGWNKEDFERHNIEFLISFKATDDTFMQAIHTRTSYKFEEIVWGAKFTRMFEPGEDGATILNLDKINEYENASL